MFGSFSTFSASILRAISSGPLSHRPIVSTRSLHEHRRLARPRARSYESWSLDRYETIQIAESHALWIPHTSSTTIAIPTRFSDIVGDAHADAPATNVNVYD